MKNVVIIPAPIKSHIIPTFYFASILSKNYQVTYIINNPEFKEVILNNGFGFEMVESERYGSGFFLLNKYYQNNNKITLKFVFQALKDNFNNEDFKHRTSSLLNTIKGIDFDLILIDVFSITDFYILYPYIKGKKIALYCPMLNTYEDFRNPNIMGHVRNKRKLKLDNVISQFNPKIILGKIFGYNIKTKLKWIYKRNNIPSQLQVSKNNFIINTIESLPELILAPLELEFSTTIKRQNQEYLGISVYKNEIINNDDLSCLIAKYNKRKIIYCSFGGYTSKHTEYKEIGGFCMKLIGEFHDESEFIFVISIKDDIIQALKRIISFPNNFYFFSNVNQMYILRHSDLFITHGGLGSIKESIYLKVPMIVYPLDKKWDQVGNAQKIEFHRLGLCGDINEDSKKIKNRILSVLSNSLYKNNIIRFKLLLDIKYCKYNNIENLLNLFSYVK